MTNWIKSFDPELGIEYFSVYTDSGNGTDAEIAGRIGEEKYADLIAAAPELLESLKIILTDYVEICGDEPEENLFVIQARAAVNKARGV